MLNISPHKKTTNHLLQIFFLSLCTLLSEATSRPHARLTDQDAALVITWHATVSGY